MRNARVACLATKRRRPAARLTAFSPRRTPLPPSFPGMRRGVLLELSGAHDQSGSRRCGLVQRERLRGGAGGGERAHVPVDLLEHLGLDRGPVQSRSFPGAVMLRLPASIVFVERSDEPGMHRCFLVPPVPHLRAFAADVSRKTKRWVFPNYDRVAG